MARPRRRKKRRRIRFDRIVFLVITMMVSVMMLIELITVMLDRLIISENDSRLYAQTETARQSKPSFTVLLDPGHGGYDAGTSVGIVNEKDITLDVALLVGRMLKQEGVTVYYTRNEDQALGSDEKADLRARKNMVKQAHADLFLSIHVNYFEEDNVSGYEVWADHANPSAKLLAVNLNEALREAQLAEERGIRNGNDRYFLTTDMDVPAVLLEIGYLSAAQDRKWMTQDQQLEQEAKAITEGILSYQNSNR